MFLQETHSVKDYYVSWKTEYGGNILLDDGNRNFKEICTTKNRIMLLTPTVEIIFFSILHNNEKMYL